MSTTGQKKLGEKYRFYVKGDDIHSYKGISDSDIAEAQDYLTKAFGVRVTTIEDLDALHDSKTSYYARPEKSDIPEASVDRAILLAKNYVPYNDQRGSWTPEKFLTIPYQSAVPAITFGDPPPQQTIFAPPATDIVSPTTPPVDQHTQGTVNNTNQPSPAQTPAEQTPSTTATTSNTTPSENTNTGTAPASASATASATGSSTESPWYKKYWWAIGLGAILIAGGAYLLVKRNQQ